MNNQMLADAEKLTADMVTAYAEEIHEVMSGLPQGTHEMRDDMKFLTWFTMMNQRDPQWVQAISYFPEGRRWIQRYIRLMGLEAPNGLG